jgi:hypothetical protein
MLQTTQNNSWHFLVIGIKEVLQTNIPQYSHLVILAQADSTLDYIDKMLLPNQLIK